MLAYHLDTALIAIPNYGLDHDQAEQIIERAFAFSRAVASHAPIRFVVSSNAEECLWSCGCGPDHAVVGEFLDMLELSAVYSANDVAKTYQTLLDRSARADEIGLSEVTTFSSLEVHPALPRGATPVDLFRETERVSATVAYGQSIGSLNGMVPGWSPLTVNSARVAVEIEATNAVGIEPFVVAETTDYLASPAALVELEKSWEVWRLADSPQAYHLAIALRASEIIRQGGPVGATSDLKKFSIGADFPASLARNQCAGEQPFSGACLTLCGQIISDRCNRFQGPMGRPNQTIRSFDGASGWRVHLTDAHQALRLMYWNLGNSLEFANVGPKFELLISEGTAGSGAACNLDALGI
jgi:hypothetical protein